MTSPSARRSRRRVSGDDEQENGNGSVTPPEAWVEEFGGYGSVDGQCNFIYMSSDSSGRAQAQRCVNFAEEMLPSKGQMDNHYINGVCFCDMHARMILESRRRTGMPKIHLDEISISMVETRIRTKQDTDENGRKCLGGSKIPKRQRFWSDSNLR